MALSTTTVNPVHYQRLTSLGPVNYPEVAQSKFGFQASRILLKFISGTGPVTFSTNGKDDHGNVGGTGSTIEVELFVKTNQVWFKGGSSAVVDIWAEPYR